MRKTGIEWIVAKANGNKRYFLNIFLALIVDFPRAVKTSAAPTPNKILPLQYKFYLSTFAWVLKQRSYLPTSYQWTDTTRSIYFFRRFNQFPLECFFSNPWTCLLAYQSNSLWHLHITTKKKISRLCREAHDKNYGAHRWAVIITQIYDETTGKSM